MLVKITSWKPSVVQLFLTLLFLQFLALTCKLASLSLHSTWDREYIIYSATVGVMSEAFWLLSVIGAVKYGNRLTSGRSLVFVIISVIFALVIFGVVM